MSNSYILNEIHKHHARLGTDGVIANWYSQGMSGNCPVIPQNILAWIDTRSLIHDPPRSHQFFILKLALNSGYKSILDGHSFLVPPGSALLLFPFQVHANAIYTGENAGDEKLLVSFSIRNNDILPLLPLKNRIMALDHYEEELLLDVVLAYQKIKISPTDAVLKLTKFLSRRLEKLALPPEPPSGDAAAPDARIQEIAAYIHDNYAQPLSLKSIAAHFNISTQTVRRLFLRQYGSEMTPALFLRRIRLQRASELLLRTECKIGEISTMCGFSDQFQFCRAFKALRGISPSAYRKYQAEHHE